MQRSCKPKAHTEQSLTWSVNIQEWETLVLLVAHCTKCMTIILLIRMSLMCVCVCVCVWESPSSLASFPAWHQISAPCQGHPSFLLLGCLTKPHLTTHTFPGQWAELGPCSEMQTVHFQPVPDSHECDHSGSLAGSSSEQANRRDQPCFAAGTRCAKMALMSRGRGTGRWGREDLSPVRTELRFTIQIKFLGYFYGESLAISKSSTIA